MNRVIPPSVTTGEKVVNPFADGVHRPRPPPQRSGILEYNDPQTYTSNRKP